MEHGTHTDIVMLMGGIREGCISVSEAPSVPGGSSYASSL